MDEQKPKVGVGVMIIKDGKILLGKRKNAHGAGEYAFPGGHLEHMETILDCAARETSEETGIQLENERFLCLSNEKEYAPKHYINIGVIADWKKGEPAILEPDKCENWAWYDIDKLPQPLYGVLPNYIEAYKTGRNFFDT